MTTIRESAASWLAKLFRGARRRDVAVVALAATLMTAAIFGLLYDMVDTAVRRWSNEELSRRAHLMAAAIDSDGSPEAAATQRLLDSYARHWGVAGLVACSDDGTLIGRRRGNLSFGCRSEAAMAAAHSGGTLRTAIGSRNVAVTAHRFDGRNILYIVQDRAFMERRRKAILGALFGTADVVVIALLLLAGVGARIGSRRMEEAARSIVRRMRATPDAAQAVVPSALRLLVRDVEATVAHLRMQPAERSAGAERLRVFANAHIPDGGLVVVANREPYEHGWGADGGVVLTRPASGLVSGIEPLLRACGGTWIAHASGSADRQFAGRNGCLAVPPDAPEYTLRRVWLHQTDYDRYYCGAANEALWPLCHIAHAQPAFRAEDWIAYQTVNETFARAAVDEAAADGLLLVQDYHFALVPRMVRQLAPHIVTSLFWHIPWPHSEVIGICPWKEGLLEGMIGADVVGFHTRQFCLNFLQTVERYLECRVDYDEMSVTHRGHRTLVRAYPISVEWPYPSATREEGEEVRRSLRIPAGAHVSIGVDRADYTKGLPERIAAVELLLEQNPALAGTYVLVQLASPTRTRIRRYQQLMEEIRESAERVNRRFGNDRWEPIVLQTRMFSPEEVKRYYAMADSALVTPLHDGMNLVAKEYAAASDDGEGALILSRFAGASKELEGALLVNPYDIDEVAQTILRAIRMPAAERRARMQSMRQQIAANSIYDWGENLLKDMCERKRQRTPYWPAADTAPSRLREIAG